MTITIPAERLANRRMGFLPERMIVLGRRPILLALLLGCGVSLLASGRFTPRLIVDGMLSFAFVPISVLVGFAVVYRGQRASAGFADAADRFFAGDIAWRWWMVTLMVAAAALPARRLGSLLAPILMTMPIPLLVSIVVDWRFFQKTLGRTAGRAAADVALHRAITWTLVIAYFLGIASDARDFLYLFVEIGQEVSAWVVQML